MNSSLCNQVTLLDTQGKKRQFSLFMVTTFSLFAGLMMDL